jgi:uncharacterized membrane protein
MNPDSARLRLKTWICTLIVVFSNAFGDFFMKRGLPESAQLSTPLEYVGALFQPWVALGVALLSWADLSYVLPVTSVGYVVVALIGKVMLNEAITGRRWTGIVLIMAGVALVSCGSAPSTTHRKAAAAGGSR